ncbi:hypothetical protein BpHYR1_012591 [Brachionus plicatilis]|uniref:Uncharacterized protein n=1 Tax=Brachionus plicatilis TaxID=10195 RepID=A0A3M7T2J6_BRAPC|nr:hypothetical protein BpHYR1_012591 [Brachionus plicatilis]
MYSLSKASGKYLIVCLLNIVTERIKKNFDVMADTVFKVKLDNGFSSKILFFLAVSVFGQTYLDWFTDEK